MVFLALFDIYEQRTRFFSREPDSQEFLKSLKTCLVGVFWVFHGIFSIIRHFSQEPDFSAKNRIFKNFLKCLKACLGGVFWVFQSIFSIVRHLDREPDIWAENRIFKNFLKSLKTCLVGIFWVFQSILAQFEIWAENHIFEPRTGFSGISQKASKHVLLVFSGCFKVFLSIARHMSREPDFWAEN